MGLFARLFRLIWGADVDRALRPVLAVTFASSVGGSTVWSFVGLWAIRHLHASQSAVGVAFLISAMVGVLAGYAGGHLSDHVGRRPLILISWACQVALMLGFLAAGGHELVGLGLMCLGGLVFQIGNASSQAMIADLVPPERHEQAYAAVRVAANLGVTLGPPTGGLLLFLGSWSALFAGAATLFFGGFVLALRFLPRHGDYAPEEPPTRHSFGVIVRDRPFLLFLVSSALAWLVYVSFEVVLPISLVQGHGLSAPVWGALVIVNPIVVTLFQLRLIRLVQPVPAALQLAVALPLMGFPFLLLRVVDAVPAVAAMILVFVVGEMLWVPTSQTIVAGLAPEDVRGAYMGAFGSMGAIGFALAPFLGLQIRATYGDAAVWVAVAALSLVAAAIGAAACRIALARRPRPVSAAALSAYTRDMETISFARGVPAPECIPVEELADCARAAIEEGGAAVLSYGPGGGYAPLRAWLGERYGVEPERVVVTNGSLQGFVFLAERLAAGRRVLVEAPTYDRPLRILARLGAEVVALPMDEEGLDPDALEAALRDGPAPAFLYTIPTFQNPSGRTLPLERRRRVLEVAARHGLLVVEDDPYGLVSFDAEPPPTLHELAGGEGVVHSSSFSKTIAPGVRVGWFVLPRPLAEDLEALAVSTYVTPPFLTQATVFEFLRRGSFEPNLERVRGLLRARRDAMLAALERHFAGGWSRPGGGYFLWLDLADALDAADLLERATAAGVTFVKGADFFPGGEGGRSSARLAYSFVSPAEIEEGVERLAAVVPARISA